MIPDWIAEQLGVDDVFSSQGDDRIAVHGVQNADGRWRVRQALTDEALDGLVRAAWLQQNVRHPVLVEVADVLRSPEGTALVQPWVHGRTLWAPQDQRHRAKSGPGRFRKLELGHRLGALAALNDVMLTIAEAGFVGTDLDARCLNYDFQSFQLWVRDLDGFRQGSFTVEQPSTVDWAAPEERTVGATLDQRTTVYQLASAAAELLADDEGDLLAPPDKVAILEQALSDDPDERHPTVRDYLDALAIRTGT